MLAHILTTIVVKKQEEGLLCRLPNLTEKAKCGVKISEMFGQISTNADSKKKNPSSLS